MNLRIAAFAACCLLTFAVDLLAEDWPEFLGHQGSAKSDEIVPTVWNESENLNWSVQLPGSGSSSPIIVGDKLIVTSYLADSDQPKRLVLCYHKETGESLWTAEFPVDYREDRYQGYITEHGYASNTPVSDGEQVFVFFGKGGVHALTLDGERTWSVDVGKESSNRQWGSAASLLMYEDNIVVNASDESQALIALNKATGEVAWKQEAGMLELTYGTPRMVTLEDGTKELVVSVPNEIWSMNPQTGDLKWYCQSPMTGNVCPSVIVDKDTIYSFGGYRGSGSIAVRAGGEDDVSDSHVVWSSRTSSYVSTPLLVEERFYWVSDRGIAFCTSAKDGTLVYQSRVDDLSGGRPVYASPVLIGKHIYVVTRRSGTLVYLPSDDFELVAQNRIAGDDTDFNASPAVSDGKLYLRSNQALYCISSSN